MKEKVKSFFNDQWKTIKREFTSEPLHKMIKNMALVIIGAFLLALGTEFFFVPLNIIGGGVSSLALIFNSIPGMNKISVETYILIINWAFFFIGLFTLGLKYSLKTLIVTIAYPLFVLLIDFIIKFISNNYFNLNVAQVTGFTMGNVTIDDNSARAITYIVGAVLGSFLNGVGVALALAGGGSSGGTDVIVLLFHKYFHLAVGTGSFIVDFSVILIGFFVNSMNLLPTLVGVMAAFLVSVTLDKVYLSRSQYYMAFIVSKKWQEINDYILEKVGRGTTIIKAQGGFSGVDTMLLEVCFDQHDYFQIESIINGIDPNAFVTVMRTQEIVGYGFTRDTPESEAKDIALSPDEAEKIILKARKKKEKELEKQIEKEKD